MAGKVFVFDEDSLMWLKKNNFSDKEIEELTNVLGRMAKHIQKSIEMGGEPEMGEQFFVPKKEDLPRKVSAMLFLLSSITDAEGNPLWIKEGTILTIPNEARSQFEDGVELEKLDEFMSNINDNLRKYSYPKRRGMRKG